MLDKIKKLVGRTLKPKDDLIEYIKKNGIPEDLTFENNFIPKTKDKRYLKLLKKFKGIST